MTRTLFIAAALLAALVVGLFIVGLVGNTPAALIVSILCAMPLFAAFLGAALGRASNEFTIARKTPNAATIRATTTHKRAGGEIPLG